MPTAPVADVAPDPRTPREILREFRALAERVPVRAAGLAKGDPEALAGPLYRPRHRVDLFDAVYYLTDQQEDSNIGFLVAYVGLRDASGTPPALHPRIFYKDSSLVWRVGTHYVRTEDENWIGKGDVKWAEFEGELALCSAEETTNLPFELQAALDDVSRRGGKHRRNEDAVPLILRNAPEDRIEPYADFVRPRRAAVERWGAVNGGKPVARFRKKFDPSSLTFARGYEPDFAGGLIDESRSASKLYGGAIRKLRILSRNARIQYQFVVGPELAWINPAQTLTRDLSTYGVRTLDVPADEDLFLPGYEYHYLDDAEDPPRLHTQIPEGFAGAPSPLDPFRADASAWIEALPVMREFRASGL